MSGVRPAAFGLDPGTRIGRYEVLAQLAVGGMAELYVARQSGISGFERTVALKRILPHLTADAEFVRMFLDEARIVAGLDHPNIAQVTDIDVADGQYFFAMEYVHGRDLRQLIKAGGALSMSMALRIVSHVASGLHHAHEALDGDGRRLGLVHRDVSPSNVMVAYSGAVKLTDFGIAKASERTSRTLEGRIKGKVGYMSPEQCRGEAVDRRSDIFVLGILLYELSTSMRAFYSQNDFATMARITRVQYTPPTEHDPDYPIELERIIDRALRKDPDERYATAAQVRDAIDEFAREHQIPLGEAELVAHMKATFGTPDHPQTLAPLAVQGAAAPVTAPGTATRRRRRWTVSLGAAALGSLALYGGYAAIGRADAGGEAVPESDRVQAPAPVAAEPSVDVVILDEEPEAEAEPEPEVVDDGSPEPRPQPKRRNRPKRSRRRAKPQKKSSLPYPPGYE